MATRAGGEFPTVWPCAAGFVNAIDFGINHALVVSVGPVGAAHMSQTEYQGNNGFTHVDDGTLHGKCLSTGPAT